ncbi:MAG: HEPN domain-containing protein [candidate division Zixibacteria bacterium]|nr:HEPN domain-containing protein [Candidatus Tariuqbacter arcticus]
MTRDDLIEMALLRLKDARVLLSEGNYSGAYYLAGYVIECGLKACIAKKTIQYEFPNLQTVRKSHTHNLETLVIVSGLKSKLLDRIKMNPVFGNNWAIVIDWTEESRYEQFTHKNAIDIISAIIDKEHGVLEWLKLFW